MSNSKWVLAVPMLVALVLSACTSGAFLGQPEKAKLKDLYVTSTGVMVHEKLGLYLGAQLTAIGATSVGINGKVPATLYETDLWARWQAADRSTCTLEIYEIKPASNFSKPELTEKAKAQINRYVDYHRVDAMEECNVKTGGWIDTNGKAVTVPRGVIPEADNRCIKVTYWTVHSIAPGVVFYAYDWMNQDCRSKANTEKIANIRGFINDAVTWNSKNKSMQSHQRAMLQLAEEGAVAELSNILLYPGGDATISEQKIIDELASQTIPMAFKDWSATDPLIWPSYVDKAKQDNPWECPAKKRAC